MRWRIRFITPKARPGNFGRVPSDYQAVQDWFDASKEHLALFTHRALRQQAQGLIEPERLFGLTPTNSARRDIPVLWIGEQHDVQTEVNAVVRTIAGVSRQERSPGQSGPDDCPSARRSLGVFRQ